MHGTTIAEAAAAATDVPRQAGGVTTGCLKTTNRLFATLVPTITNEKA